MTKPVVASNEPKKVYKTRSRSNKSKDSRKNKSKTPSKGGNVSRSSQRNRSSKTSTRKVKSAPSDWKPTAWPINDYIKKYSVNMNKSIYTNKYK